MFTKIFICGLGCSGKGLMKQMLDGHSQLGMMPFQGFILKKLCDYNFKAQNLRVNSEYRTEYFKNHPFFTIIDTDEKYRIYFDEFIRNIYYSIDLHIAYRSKKIWGEAGQGKDTVIDFDFDFPGFEDAWYTELFDKCVEVSIDKFLNIMYLLFMACWNNKHIKKFSGMAITVQNGIDPVRWLFQNTQNAKYIFMRRSGVEISYALALRKEKTFRQALFNPDTIDLIQRYNEFLEGIKNTPYVKIIEFRDLVLNHQQTMDSVSEFLGINKEPILYIPTLNKIRLETQKTKFVGKINDDPYAALSSQDISLLKYMHKETRGGVGLWLKSKRWGIDRFLRKVKAKL